MDLYLIRHGQALNNVVADEYELQTLDAPLTDLGITQAQQLAAWLPHYLPSVDAIYTSTLQRARDTARPLEKAYNLNAESDHCLREIFTCHADQTPVPAEQQLHTVVNRYQEPFSPLTPDIPNCESYIQFRVRVSAFIESLTRRHLDQTVLLVCHGGVISAAHSYVFEEPIHRRAVVRVPNTSLTFFHYQPRPQAADWTLFYLGKAEHLQGI